MLNDIIINERGAENYLAQGFSASLSDPQESVSLLSEWATGVSSFILKDQKRSLSTGYTSQVLKHIISWFDQSLLSIDIFSTSLSSLIDDFVDRHIVVMHIDAEQLYSIQSRIDFDWGVAGMPGLNLRPTLTSNISIDGKSSMTLSGRFIGVSKNSKNPTAAIKLALFLSSTSYVKELITNPKYNRAYLYPIYPELLKGTIFFHLFFLTTFYYIQHPDQSICSSLGKLCLPYSTSQISVRPSTLFPSTLFQTNASLLISSTLEQIFSGVLSVGDGIIVIDDSLRSLLKIPLSKSTLDDETLATKPRQKFNNLYEQILLLFLFIGCGVTSVVMYKRKTMLEEIDEKRKESVRRGKEIRSVSFSDTVGVPIGYQATADFSETARLITRPQ